MSSAPRLVLLMGAAHRDFAAELASELGAAAVVLERRSLGVKFRLLGRRARKQGLLAVAGQLALRVWLKAFGGRVRGVKRAAGEFPLGCAVLTVPDINQQAAAELIAEHRATVVGVYGTSILRGEALASLPANNFNLHTGLTQHFRGMASTFWALESGHPEHIGVTVHRISAGVDTGVPVAQAELGYDAYNAVGTMEELDAAVANAGEKLLASVLKRALRGEALAALDGVNPALGAYRTQPTLRQYRRVCRRFKLS